MCTLSLEIRHNDWTVTTKSGYRYIVGRVIIGLQTMVMYMLLDCFLVVRFCFMGIEIFLIRVKNLLNVQYSYIR